MEAKDYISELFPPTDHVAIVLISRVERRVIQRILPAGMAAEDKYQAWLRHMNSMPRLPGEGTPGRPYDLYISMNTLKPDARGRTKADIQTIRHVYLDIDENGREVVERVLNRGDIPTPNYLLESSPGKFQLVWKAEGFTPESAERLTRNMAQDLGADAAVWDASRVLRLPGFANHKYLERPWVKVSRLEYGEISAENFPRTLLEKREDEHPIQPPGWSRGSEKTGGSQSERDWGYAMRRLRAGESPDQVEAAIAGYRRDRGDKQYPEAYAKRTVERAKLAVEREYGRSR